MTSTTSELPMILGEVAVVATERISPSFVRIELGGPAFADFGVDGPLYDQRIKLIVPGPGGSLPTLAAHSGWYADWLALPGHERGNMRTYTVRDVRGTGPDTRLVVDVVLHEAPECSGPGSRWAARARTGDRVVVCAPRRGVAYGGIEFAPSEGDELLLVADETAVPALAGILRDLPPNARGTAFAEVPHSGDVLPMQAPTGVRVVWLPRDRQAHGVRQVGAVRRHLGLSPVGSVDEERADDELWETPTYSSTGESLAADGVGSVSELYAWVAGESRMVTALRRALVGELGLARSQVAFMGYWRQGVAMKG